MRELRENLAEYLESSVPIEVTRHGQTIGLYIPVPWQPSQLERDALHEAGRRIQEEMKSFGIGDFEVWWKSPNAA